MLSLGEILTPSTLPPAGSASCTYDKPAWVNAESEGAHAVRLLLLVLTHPFDSTSESEWVFRRAEERRAFVLVGPLKHSQDSLCDLCV